jgi:hypothetical protein
LACSVATARGTNTAEPAAVSATSVETVGKPGLALGPDGTTAEE